MMHEFNWRNRKTTLAALLITLLVFVILEYLAQADASLLEKYGLSQSGIQLYYSLLIGVLAVLVVVEPKLRPILRRGRISLVIVLGAGVIGFLAFRFAPSGQDTRLFQFPFSLWLMIVHLVALCALAVCLVTDRPGDEPDHLSQRLVVATMAVFGLILAVLHVVSLGEFTPHDSPDEPWFASIATNFAANGDFSPSFTASPNGSPDPIVPRYYWLMGIWLRLIGDETLAQLRTFPLLIAAITVVILGLALWRNPSLTLSQRLAGIVILLGLTFFLRPSHNLRMDIGLAVYGALILLGLSMFFERQQYGWRWPLLMGAALFLGLETVPTAALALGFAVGLSFIVWFLRQPDRRSAWRPVAIYAAACLGAGFLYGFIHFLSDPQSSLAVYGEATSMYVTRTSNTLGFTMPANDLIGYHLRFSLSLAPLELIGIAGALVLLWRSRLSGVRWVLLPFGLSIIILFSAVSVTYGYWVLYAPLAAYAIAWAWRTKIALRVGGLILVPAMLAAPIHDISHALQEGRNQAEIGGTAPLLEQIPEGSTIVGEPVFWFNLHSDRNFIGWNGVYIYTRRHNQTLADALQVFDTDVVICWRNYESRCAEVANSGLFAPPEEFAVGSEVYLVYKKPSE